MLLPHGKRAVCLTLIHFLGQSKVICAQRGFSPNGETQSNAMCQLLLSVFTMSTSLSHTPQLPSPLRHLNLFTTYNTHTHTEGSKLFVVYFIFLLGLVKSTKKTQKEEENGVGGGRERGAAAKCGASSVISCHRPIKRSRLAEACDPIPDVPYRRGAPLSLTLLPSLLHTSACKYMCDCVCPRVCLCVCWRATS